jgi:acyl-CoA synthetase (AMP-forming)/AMP-acid ligase II
VITETLLRDTASIDPVQGGLALLISQQATRCGDRTYLEDANGDSRMSFRELAGTTSQWAGRLETEGIAADAVIALSIADPLTFASTFLSLIAAGRWTAPLDHHAGDVDPTALAASAQRVHAEVLITDRPLPDGMGLRVLVLGDDHPVQGSPLPLDSLGGGAVLASSGTTGTPKVIPLAQRQLLCTASNVAQHHQLTPQDRGFNSLPLFHINAEVVGLLATLIAGSTLVLADRFRRTNFWDTMAQRDVTWINAVPAIVTLLADLRPDETIPHGIRFIRSASAPLPAHALESFEAATGIPVLETYGMTEGASQITANPLRGVRKPGSVGLPVGVELRIVPYDAEPEDDPSIDLLTGQVEIRGPSVITAYGNGEHADRFDPEGWLKTGDIGHIDSDGYLFLDGRIDDVINRSGEKVFPREIEEAILMMPEVTAAVVVGLPDPVLGQVPVAYLVLADASRAVDVVAQVKQRLELTLVRSRRPVELRVVASFPSGATGKVQRRRVRDGQVAVLYRCECR